MRWPVPPTATGVGLVSPCLVTSDLPLEPRPERSRGQSIGGNLCLGRIDFDAAFEMGAIFDADAGGGDVAGDGAVLLDVNPPAGMDVADDLAVDDDFAGVYFRIELGIRTDGKFVPGERNRTVYDAVNVQVFASGDLPFDLEAGAQARRTERLWTHRTWRRRRRAEGRDVG